MGSLLCNLWFQQPGGAASSTLKRSHEMVSSIFFLAISVNKRPISIRKWPLYIPFAHTKNHFLKETGPSKKHPKVDEQEPLPDSHVSMKNAMCTLCIVYWLVSLVMVWFVTRHVYLRLIFAVMILEPVLISRFDLFLQLSCILEFDGASKGNPGKAGAGAIIRRLDGSVVCSQPVATKLVCSIYILLSCLAGYCGMIFTEDCSTTWGSGYCNQQRCWIPCIDPGAEICDQERVQVYPCSRRF